MFDRALSLVYVPSMINLFIFGHGVGSYFILQSLLKKTYLVFRNVRVAERLALPTSDHGVAGSNPAGGEILPEPKRLFIAQSLSYSPFHRLEMTEILLKGRKTLTYPLPCFPSKR